MEDTMFVAYRLKEGQKSRNSAVEVDVSIMPRVIVAFCDPL